MRFDFYGLAFETPRVTFYLWSPWRASALEHRVFEAVRGLPRAQLEQANDELRVTISDPKTARQALQAAERVLKGWQEEGDPGTEKRAWRWMLEGDTDAHGYDHTGEPVGLWGFLRLGLDRGGVGEQERGEDIDLDWFGFLVEADRPQRE
jgi:hypothetical protein